MYELDTAVFKAVGITKSSTGKVHLTYAERTMRVVPRTLCGLMFHGRGQALDRVAINNPDDGFCSRCVRSALLEQPGAIRTAE